MEIPGLMVPPDRKENLENLDLVEQLALGQMDLLDHLDLEDSLVKLEKLDHLGPWA